MPHYQTFQLDGPEFIAEGWAGEQPVPQWMRGHPAEVSDRQGMLCLLDASIH